MRKVLNKLSAVIAGVMALLVVAQPIVSIADVPYKTFSQNGYGEYIQSQTAYTPGETIYKIVDNATDEIYYLDGANDMMLASDGLIYIADTGNDRILVCDKDGNFVKKIDNESIAPEGTPEDEIEKIIYKPEGLYVTAEGDIYVCIPLLSKYVNYGAVLKFNSDGELVDRYDKPESLLFGNDAYKPRKLIVDNGGNMYVVSQGNSNGIVQLTQDSTFLGYFGTGEVFYNFMDIFLNLVLSDEQLASRAKRVPQTTNNLCIDKKGIIYTLVDGTSGQTLKKLNKAGTNMLELEVMPFYATSVTVGQYENIYVATSTGFIYEYTKEGTLLFRFGGEDSTSDYRVGLFSKAGISAIAVDENDMLYVLDSKANTINKFNTTEFTDYVHQSLGYYQKGDYVNTKIYLEEIIDMNSMFDYANQAMGLTLFNEEKYEESMGYFRLAKDKLGYSDAFWEIRNVWLTNNLIIVIIAVVVLFLIWKVLSTLDKKKKIFDPVRKVTAGVRENLIVRQIFFGFRFIRHPIDGAYEIKHYKMSSNIISAGLVVVYMVIFIINKYFGGFLVKTARDGRYNLLGDIGIFVIGFLAAGIVTYLICTINDGEGKFKEILAGYVYSFTPYLIIQPILFVIGMGVTNNEMFIIEFANLIMISYILILMFLAIKEINNYTVMETFKVIFLTVFAAFIFALIIFVIYVLGQQLMSFVISIYGEVVYRIGR
ncbi:MAG: hypothetical protein E7266_07570 [Lachnospiraceae bacterium]|nr:hypothetical protein [Lachnospiraceae bacterium]